MSSLPLPEARPDYEAAAHPGSPAAAAAAATSASLYETYSDRIFGFCFYRLGSREEAEDATQTTFLLALAELERGVVPRLEANWLFTIAHNACRTRIRTRGRSRQREVLSDPTVLEEIALSEPASGDELLGLDAALADMPELQRRALVLREWRGCSYREIAEELGLSNAAVETLIFRARRSLAQRLEHAPAAATRRTGVVVLDFGSLLSSLKSVLGLGTTAKGCAAACATAGAIAIGLGVPSDSPRAAPEAPPPAPTRILTSPVPPAAVPASPGGRRADGGRPQAPGSERKDPAGPATETPFAPAPAPVAGLVEGVEQDVLSPILTGPLVQDLPDLERIVDGATRSPDGPVAGVLDALEAEPLGLP